MSTDSWSPYILTFVTFAPLVGALLLVLFPRRDRDIRIFALVFSLLTFLLSLHLPVYFHRSAAGFQYEVNRLVDLHSQHSLPHGHRRHLPVAGGV